MSRQEDFKQASQSLEIQVISNPWTLFEKGCEHGYQYAIEKACEWLADRVTHDSIDYPMATGCLINDFRKAMEKRL